MLNGDITTQALLIHCHQNTKNVEVCRHNVIKTKGGFTLGAGRVFSDSDKKELVDILTGSGAMTPTLLPDSVLVYSPRMIAWYVKPSKRDIRFKSQGETVVIPNVPYPAHILSVFNGQFYAFAIKQKSRPTNDTELYYSPTPNVYSDGHICTGNVNLPFDITLGNISEWQDFFFECKGSDSHTKNVVGVENYSGLQDFWNGLSGASSFPTRKLVPVRHTLGSFISNPSREQYYD